MNPPPSHSRAPSRTTNPTPRTTVSHSRTTSNAPHRAPLPLPPQAPRPSRSRRPIDATQINFLISSLQERSVVPRASCGKVDDILAPPDAQSCPFAKAGMKVLGSGVGGYGELEGWIDWPVELYDHEREEARVFEEIKVLYSQDENLRTTETAERVMENLRARVAKLKEDEWMYSSTDNLYQRERD